jgi:hypothetical protein
VSRNKINSSPSQPPTTPPPSSSIPRCRRLHLHRPPSSVPESVVLVVDLATKVANLTSSAADLVSAHWFDTSTAHFRIPSLAPPLTAYKQQMFQSFQVVLCVLKIHCAIAPGVRCWPPWGIFETTLHPSALLSNNIHLAEDVCRLWSRRPSSTSALRSRRLFPPRRLQRQSTATSSGECVDFFGDLDLCHVGTFL